MKDINKYRGCLLGGAAGDALGFPVEFLQDEQIFKKYGENGITEYELYNDVAEISDDTQMTLFTANGLLRGSASGRKCGNMADYTDYIAQCYDDWLLTQSFPPREPGYISRSWLINVPQLNHERVAGRTCLSALRSGRRGTIINPINNSKGCGGLMRVAPIGLFFPEDVEPDAIDLLGAESAALTHGHELGYIPAAAFVHIIHQVAHKKNADLRYAVDDALSAVERLFPEAHSLNDFVSLIKKACLLSEEKDLDDLEGIRALGEGWVAEETLAIAVYCSLKYKNDFEKGIVAAVNHSGDSDSTGSVTGNILGALLGIGGIPEKFLFNLELREVITEIADDLFTYRQGDEFRNPEDNAWEQKYLSFDCMLR